MLDSLSLESDGQPYSSRSRRNLSPPLSYELAHQNAPLASSATAVREIRMFPSARGSL